jgi:radical SAM superfamily enzyme YgiQ (UPF0313 family)
VTAFNGGKYRLRPIDDVMCEVERSGKNIFFCDDNLIGSGAGCRRRARKLFDRMKGLGKMWHAQTCLNIADDEDLLHAAARSGAKLLFIGFESVDAGTLAAMNKRINDPAKRSAREAIKKIHDHGLGAVGAFVLGNDTDTKDTFDRTLEFIYETKLDGVQVSILTPLPGTTLYRQLDDEGRILKKNYPADWERYSVFDVVFQPKNMTVDELREGVSRIYKETASLSKCLGRAMGTLRRSGSSFLASTMFLVNRTYHNSFLRAR